MLRLQPFALLAVLTILDGAALKDPQCLFHKGAQSPFCKHVVAAYKQNQETLLRMSLPKFDDAKVHLTKANEEILVVLSKKQARRLFQPLRQALESESEALFEVLSECLNNVTVPLCSTIFRGLFKATTDLVEATIIVTDGEKKKSIKKLYETFKKQDNQSESITCLVTNVLMALL